jgi:tetratricopeptide (TPR) repeat protein
MRPLAFIASSGLSIACDCNINKQGKYSEAEEMHQRTLELSERVLGNEHPWTLMSMSNLAVVLDSQGKYEEAEEMHRQTLELREKVLGKEHPSTLASIYCLAFLLHNVTDHMLYEEA